MSDNLPALPPLNTAGLDIFKKDGPTTLSVRHERFYAAGAQRLGTDSDTVKAQVLTAFAEGELRPVVAKTEQDQLVEAYNDDRSTLKDVYRDRGLAYSWFGWPDPATRRVIQPPAGPTLSKVEMAVAARRGRCPSRPACISRQGGIKRIIRVRSFKVSRERSI